MTANVAKRSDAMVIFGATGDLAYKQIFPSVAAMIRRGHLDMPIIGVAKAGWDLPKLLARAKASLEEHGAMDAATFGKLTAQLRYIDGDYKDAGTFVELRKELGSAKRPLHYLAIPPTLFGAVAEGLAKSGCGKDARVVVEKPFGRNLATAQELNRTLHQYFAEESLFRIDHYLGKEPVQNLVYFRFANPIAEAGWNKHHVESVQVTMAEEFGIKGRGKLYEELGALRDVVQNHMLQVVACLAMECPKGKGHDALRDERGKLLQEVRALGAGDVVRGQFRGYRQEQDVAADSKVETFAAMRFHVDSSRWEGVPFFVRVGKCMPVTATEVMVRFKRLRRPLFGDVHLPRADYFRFRLSPRMTIALGANVKKAGEGMVGEGLELVLHDQMPDQMQPYERLLGDASNGDPTLFARQDAVEAAWRIVDPVLDGATPVLEYEPGTWGPKEVGGVLVPEGGWNNPACDDV